MENCKVITKNGFLFLIMPNGDVIPSQTSLILKNDMDGEPGKSIVTITVIADTSFIKNHIKLQNT